MLAIIPAHNRRRSMCMRPTTLEAIHFNIRVSKTIRRPNDPRTHTPFDWPPRAQAERFTYENALKCVRVAAIVSVWVCARSWNDVGGSMIPKYDDLSSTECQRRGSSKFNFHKLYAKRKGFKAASISESATKCCWHTIVQLFATS